MDIIIGIVNVLHIVFIILILIFLILLWWYKGNSCFQRKVENLVMNRTALKVWFRVGTRLFIHILPIFHFFWRFCKEIFVKLIFPEIFVKWKGIQNNRFERPPGRFITSREKERQQETESWLAVFSPDSRKVASSQSRYIAKCYTPL